MGALIESPNFKTTPGAVASTTPDLVLGYQAAWESNNIIHDVIGATDATEPYVTLRTGSKRVGNLALFYATESAAWAAARMHRQKDAFQFTDYDRPAQSMRYVVDGRITLELDNETKKVWFVTIPYREI